MSLSVVIPALNAATTLPACIDALARLPGEVVVVDGGSTDGTAALAARLGALVVHSPRGRGRQLAVGVAAARGEWMLLLHADTVLSPQWVSAAYPFMARTQGRAGYFRFALDAEEPQARRLERIVAWRCRRFGLPYGDQGLLLQRTLLEQVGGVRDIPLMEDVDLVRRIGPARLEELPADAVTSAAKWRQDGWTARSARNLACLGLYFLGVPPRRIVSFYE